jgi:hypothetical protein
MKLDRMGLAILTMAIIGFLTGQRANPQGASEAGPTGLSLAPGTTVNAVLNGSIDSKKAKVGDAVIAQTAEALSAGGKVIVARGTKLQGHVTQVSARGKGDADSTVGIKFDKAILKKNEEISLNLWIRAIAAQPRVTYERGPNPSAMVGPETAAAAGSPMKPTPAPIPQAATTLNSGPAGPEATDGTGGGLNAAGLLPPNSRGVYGLEGLKLSMGGSSAEPGSVITGSGKSVQLDGGTRLLLTTQ